MKKLLIAIMGLSLIATQGCTPIGAAVGAGATVGTAAAREGGVGQAWTDTRIQAYINDAWFRHNTDMFRKLDLTVREGRVMITGVVPDQQMRLDAVRLAWQAPYVRQVINEIRVENSEGISGYARDSWIQTQLRTKLVFDREIQSINYSFDCVSGVVYLMGVARDQEELERVIAHARGISYVKEVVSYVRLRTDTRPDESLASSAPAAR
jgi:osmotically-inducible protein OsmY